MIRFEALHPMADHLVGYIPTFLSVDDPRPAREQLNDNYAHGGGWFPIEGWVFNPTSQLMKYPGDPAMAPVARAQLRMETILVYPHAWVAIVKQDGSFEMARLD